MNKPSNARNARTVLVGAGLLLLAGHAVTLHAADYANLTTVKPAVSCDQLAQADIKTPDGTKIVIKTAKQRDTDKGPYCRVTGSLEPGVNFQGDLPLNNWTQRFLEGAQGREGIERAGGCMPALNGEFAVVTGGAANGGFNTDPAAGEWGMAPQARILTGYLGQHLTAVAFKAVIKAFYGQGPKFSYMAGCSGGGMQTLVEAERYPEDFDGYTIGAPPLYQTTHDLGFWHGWEYHVNQRTDGTIILAKDKLSILHDAAIEHCKAASGVIDGTLQQPTACKFDKAWVQCAAGAADTSKCLTAEEANVAEQLYLGPNDGTHYFEMSGFPLGSEMLWRLSTQGKPADGEGPSPHGIHSFIMPPLSGKTTQEIMTTFAFNQEWFDKSKEMWPLFNAGNTDLKPLAKLGHKILLWNGAEDNVVQPAGTIAYYEAVQKYMGAKEADSVVRFFLLPGVGHCGQGDGANQIDTLSPLMAWVETNKAPEVLIAGRPVPVQQTGGPGGGPGGPPAPGAIPNYPPYALPGRDIVYSRPVYPFPNVAKYKGTGDVNDAANYESVKGPLKVPQVFNSEGLLLLGADNQKFYKADGNKLVPIPKP